MGCLPSINWCCIDVVHLSVTKPQNSAELLPTELRELRAAAKGLGGCDIHGRRGIQGGAPEIANLVHNSNNYRTYGKYIYISIAVVNGLITRTYGKYIELVHGFTNHTWQGHHIVVSP